MRMRLLTTARTLPIALAALAGGCVGPLDDGPAVGHAKASVSADDPCAGEAGCVEDLGAVAIPDADVAGVSRVLLGPAGTVETLSVQVRVEHTYKGDLKVVLVSPSGTERLLHDRDGGSADDVEIDVRGDVSFTGEPSGGRWTLRVQDLARADVGTLLSWRLRFAGDAGGGGDVGDPAVDVWTSLPVPGGYETHHPYANHEDRTWDLSSVRGVAGAARVRVRFALVDVERGYDFVELLDGSGRVRQKLTGRLGAVVSDPIDGDVVKVRFRSDYSVVEQGVTIAGVDVFGQGCLADADCGDGLACPVTRVCVMAPCFQECVAEDGPPPGGECFVGGCSSQLCSDRPGLISTCEWMPWYACFRLTECGPTAGGGCGWAQTPDFRRCMEEQGGVAPVCEDGETRAEDCNTCSCVNGAWRCTEMACRPTAGEGEMCAGLMGILCDEGLTCDFHPDLAEGQSACDFRDAAGTCVRPAEACAEIYAPVCACTGQTFSNDCERIGLADFGYEGACRFGQAIPDADRDGLVLTLDAAGPAGAGWAHVELTVRHTWRGDLVVQLVAPTGERFTLTNRAGGSADDLEVTTDVQVAGGEANGTWELQVVDLASQDVGTVEFFNVTPHL